MIDKTEDEFSFPPGIGSTDKTFYILPVHQFLQNPELLFCGIGHLILPVLRKNREVFQPPFCVCLIVDFRG